MKLVKITGPRQVALADAPDPKPVGDFVVVKIHVAPMCCEYKDYKAGKNYALGHEAAGEVAAVAQPGRVKVGDRVVVMPQNACGRCRLCLAGDYIHCQNVVDMAALAGPSPAVSTYAQYVLKQDWQLVPIPDGMSYAHAAMACCGLGPTFGAMQQMKVDRFDTVVIAGLGPVGLGGVINAVHRGARVIGLEPNPYRAALARKLGAELVLDPREEGVARRIVEATDGRGADKVIDCAGVAASQRILIDATRRRGQVAFVGEAGELAINVSDDMIRKGLTLRGIWHYNLAGTPRIMDIIRANTDSLDRLITHTFPMANVREAFELQLTGECGKVLLEP